MNNQTKLLLIKVPYWLGIFADALWAVGLFFPWLFAVLTGTPDFSADFETRLIMGIGGTLMTGWTILLVWAVLKPIERRGVILITAFPVVFGMFVITLIQVLNGNTMLMWALIKTVILFLSMLFSFILAGKITNQN